MVVGRLSYKSAPHSNNGVKRGKNGKAAIVKVARKLLSRIRYVWLSGEAYQTAIVK
jgi:hypothetical protein